MDETRFLNITEAANFLETSEQGIKDLVKEGRLTAYQIGGMYLRFKQDELEDFKNNIQAHLPYKRPGRSGLSFYGNVGDFIYFNDFYIIAILLIIFLISIILKSIG